MVCSFSILPKSAVPLDKLSFIGGSANSACPVSFRFVYHRGRRFYIIERASVPNANVVKYVTTKYLLKDKKYISAVIRHNSKGRDRRLVKL